MPVVRWTGTSSIESLFPLRWSSAEPNSVFRHLYSFIHSAFIKSILPYLLPHITHIFNTILTTNIFRKAWKLSRVIPIHKLRCDSEFRSSAIQPFLSKAFEKLLYLQVCRHLVKNNLLYRYQTGCCSNNSCTTALVEIFKNIRYFLFLFCCFLYAACFLHGFRYNWSFQTLFV